MATYKCTDGNEIQILQGQLPERIRKHFGMVKADEPPFECSRCGDCCIWCFVPVHPVFVADYRVPEWLSARGAEITYEKATIDGIPIELPFLTFKLPCPNLVILSGKKTSCSIHGDKKPVICRQYRCDKDPILKELKTKKEKGREF